MQSPHRQPSGAFDLETLRSALDNAGLAIVVTGPELERPGPTIIYANPAMEALTGYAAHEMLGASPRMFQGPDTDPVEMSRLRPNLLATGHFAGGAINYRKDGTEYVVDWSISAIHRQDGTLGGWLAIQRDITRERRAQAALLASEERQRALVEGIPQLVWRATNGGDWTWCSPQWTAFTGLSAAESRGKGWLAALHPDDRSAARDAWSNARTGVFKMEGRLFHAGEGRYRWYQSRAIPIGHEDAGVSEWLGTSTDIDDLKRLQHQQQMLVAELQHRTRNLLAVVRNIARRSIPASSRRDEYDARLAALSRVQGFLSRSPGYAVSLADLVGAELAATGDDVSERVAVGGPVVTLPGESVQAVALVLHELATNAVKYGAIAQPSGRLSVTWHLEPSAQDARRRLIIQWRESGVAMPAGTPRHQGFGTELITRALQYQLQAETKLEFTADGVRCRILLPSTAFDEAG